MKKWIFYSVGFEDTDELDFYKYSPEIIKLIDNPSIEEDIKKAKSDNKYISDDIYLQIKHKSFCIIKKNCFLYEITNNYLSMVIQDDLYKKAHSLKILPYIEYSKDIGMSIYIPISENKISLLGQFSINCVMIENCSSIKNVENFYMMEEYKDFLFQ